MKATVSNWIIVLLGFNLLIGGCAPAGPLPIADGQVLALAEQSTLSGITSVLNGTQPFGQVWVRGGQMVVAWPQSGGWAWACLKFNCQDWLAYFQWSAKGNGNIANWRTWGDLADWMKLQGWTRLPSTALPGAITMGESISGFLHQMSGAIFGFMVIPVLPIPEELDSDVKL